MNSAIEIQKNIYWIGVNDRRTHIFENYWPLPKGVAYNSYVIIDEKVAVIDTVERSHMDEYLENLEAVLKGRTIDYLIINHMEPDHSGAIKTLLCHYPNLTIIGNGKTFPMLRNFYDVNIEMLEEKEGDSINLGKRTLHCFIGLKPWLLMSPTITSYSAEMCSELSVLWMAVFSMTR